MYYPWSVIFKVWRGGPFSENNDKDGLEGLTPHKKARFTPVAASRKGSFAQCVFRGIPAGYSDGKRPPFRRMPATDSDAKEATFWPSIGKVAGIVGIRSSAILV